MSAIKTATETFSMCFRPRSRDRGEIPEIRKKRIREMSFLFE